MQSFKGGEDIKTLTLRVSDEFHKALKLKTVEEETSMHEYIIKLIEKDMEIKNEPENK